MPSAGPWAAIDYKFTIRVIRSGDATVDQTTGAFTPGTTVSTDIFGAVNWNPLGRERRTAGGVVTDGEVHLYTDTTLAAGARVRIFLDSTNTTYQDFRVVGIIQGPSTLNNLIGATNRRGYRLAREGP